MSEPPIDRRPWRIGNCWGVTIIAEGSGASDEGGRRLGDSLVATALSKEWAQQICDEHNEVLRQEALEAGGRDSDAFEAGRRLAVHTLTRAGDIVVPGARWNLDPELLFAAGTVAQRKGWANTVDNMRSFMKGVLSVVDEIHEAGGEDGT